MERIIWLVIGYIFGLFQTGYIVGKLHHIDIRQQGSGNAGSTNAVRVMGWKAGLCTFAGDVLKCVLAICLTRYIYRDTAYAPMLAMYAGVGATLGHNFPFYLKFKGGKGIAVLAGLASGFGTDSTGMFFYRINFNTLCVAWLSIGGNDIFYGNHSLRRDGRSWNEIKLSY